MYPLQIALHIGERAHATPGVKSGGEGVKDHFGQKEEKSSKKWSLQNLYLRIPREMDFGLLHGSCPKLEVPLATKVWVQSIGKGFLTPQPLWHMKNEKKCKNANIGTYIPMRR